MLSPGQNTQKRVVAALIVAGGSGKRMNRSIPKQFIEIGGKSILQYTIERCQDSQYIDQILCALPPEHVETYGQKLMRERQLSKLVTVVAGGDSRHLSVWQGLQALESTVDVVMIHDGVRPFINERIIRESITAAQQHGAAVVGLVPKDTVKLWSADGVERTLDRRNVLIAQTPQTFKKEIIVRAFEHAFQTQSFSTDDAALVEQMGGKVAVVQGDWRNIKITSPEDLIAAKAYLENSGENRSRI